MASRSKPQPGLAKAVRQLRSKRRLTQEDLAHAAGLRTGAINAIESGNTNPSWATVKAIARALDVSLGELASLSEKLERG